MIKVMWVLTLCIRFSCTMHQALHPPPTPQSFQGFTCLHLRSPCSNAVVSSCVWVLGIWTPVLMLAGRAPSLLSRLCSPGLLSFHWIYIKSSYILSQGFIIIICLCMFGVVRWQLSGVDSSLPLWVLCIKLRFSGLWVSTLISWAILQDLYYYHVFF